MLYVCGMLLRSILFLFTKVNGINYEDERIMNITETEEIKKLQKQHREQLATARENIKKEKAKISRWIRRGEIAEHIFIEPENLSDEEFQKRLYAVARKGIEVLRKERCQDDIRPKGDRP